MTKIVDFPCSGELTLNKPRARRQSQSDLDITFIGSLCRHTNLQTPYQFGQMVLCQMRSCSVPPCFCCMLTISVLVPLLGSSLQRVSPVSEGKSTPGSPKVAPVQWVHLDSSLVYTILPILSACSLADKWSLLKLKLWWEITSALIIFFCTNFFHFSHSLHVVTDW